MALKVIDSHVHFWSAEHATPAEHPWMSSVPKLALERSPSQYLVDAQQTAIGLPRPDIKGVMYIETDRSQMPHFPYKLNELHYLSGLMKEYPDFILSVIPWAPLDRDFETFARYLKYIQADAPVVWRKLRGFRFLLQGIRDQQAFERLIFSDNFQRSLRHFRLSENGARELTFDVGIDQHSAGTWQLEAFTQMVGRIRGDDGEGGPTFVLNHLCKPDLERDASFDAWLLCMRKLAEQPRVYVKLSGLLSEMTPGVSQRNVADLAAVTAKWLRAVLELFGPRRCMFGSDWPVCNLNGSGQQANWQKWFEMISFVLDRMTMTGQEKQFIWWRTANEAYGLEHDSHHNID